MEQAPPPTTTKDAARTLFLLGFLTLFLELALIRYLPGRIWNLGYFPNLVLLAVFLGMGAGFVFNRRISGRTSGAVFEAAAFGLLGLVAFLHVWRPMVPGFDRWSADIGGELYFTASPASSSGPRDDVVFVFCFVAIVVIFAAISQRTAKLFGCFPPLRAYTLDILGSCAGILSFMFMSWLTVPAPLWVLALIPLFHGAASASSRSRDLLVLPLGVAAGLIALQDTRLTSAPGYTGGLEVRWSPYQKAELADSVGAHPAIFVNGIAHQVILGPADLPTSFYQIPYRVRQQAGLPAYRDVLILGAGAGNDVAAALYNGVGRVDAVEIDPVIAAFGRRFNAAHPYDDPRVHLIVDDGRAFMTRTRQRYDLIVFALTDSLVRVSSMAQLRLENYLFTEDSLRRAHGLLSENGEIVLYNYYRRPWLGEKLQRTVFGATGLYPLVIRSQGDFAMFIVGAHTHAEAPPTLKEAGVEAAVDDWPFPYLRARGIPPLYRGVMAGLAGLIALLAIAWRVSAPRAAAAAGSHRTRLAFGLMGAAFLLLETKSVVQFSLLFGTTWLNSSLVFLAVLLLVLAANWTATVFTKAAGFFVSYVLLVASCLLTFVFPLGRLLSVESFAVRAVLASLLTFLPIFFANLIFSMKFRDQAVPEEMFGWNLVGAAVGGVAEYSSMALGYSALAIVVAAGYTTVALLFWSTGLSRRSPA